MAQPMNILEVQEAGDALDAVKRSEDGVDRFHVAWILFQGKNVQLNGSQMFIRLLKEIPYELWIEKLGRFFLGRGCRHASSTGNFGGRLSS